MYEGIGGAIVGITFNANEVFELAMQIERNGQEYYQRAASLMEEADVKHQLSSLSQMEAIHEKLFARMKEQIAAGGPEMFDPDDEALHYLQAVTRGEVFGDPSQPQKMLDGTHSLEDILRTAIGLEKDSIVFYLGIRASVPEGTGRDRVDDIIKEEQRHIVLLSQRLKAISGR